MTIKNKVKKIMNGTYDFCMRNAPFILSPVTAGLAYAGISPLEGAWYTCDEQQNRVALDLFLSAGFGFMVLPIGGILRGNQLNKEHAAKAEKLTNERIAKVEAKPERKILSVEELRQQVTPRMKKDGCGCYRYPARAVYNNFSAKHPIEDLRLFTVLDGYLHSYCGNTNSSSTSSNTSVMEDVVRKCDKVILENSTFKSEAASIERIAIRGLARDNSSSINEELVLGYLNRANNGIANGDLIAALSGLYSADVALENISHSYESSRAIIQPKIEELKKYIPSNLINICNKREISFAQKVEGIKYALSSYEVSCSLSDEKRKKLQAFVLRNNLSINPAQEFSSEVDSLVNGLSGQLKKYSEEKSLVLRDVESKHEQIIEKSKNQLEYSQRQNRSYPSMGNAAQVTKAIEEYSLVNGSYEQDKSKVAGEYDTQILEVTARRDNYKKSSSELIAKINDRTMTRVEYKQLKKLNFEAKK